MIYVKLLASEFQFLSFICIPELNLYLNKTFVLIIERMPVLEKYLWKTRKKL